MAEDFSPGGRSTDLLVVLTFLCAALGVALGGLVVVLGGSSSAIEIGLVLGMVAGALAWPSLVIASLVRARRADLRRRGKRRH